MTEETDLTITPKIKGRNRNRTQTSICSDLLTTLNENMTNFKVGRAQLLTGPAYILCKLYLTSFSETSYPLSTLLYGFYSLYSPRAPERKVKICIRKRMPSSTRKTVGFSD